MRCRCVCCPRVRQRCVGCSGRPTRWIRCVLGRVIRTCVTRSSLLRVRSGGKTTGVHQGCAICCGPAMRLRHRLRYRVRRCSVRCVSDVASRCAKRCVILWSVWCSSVRVAAVLCIRSARICSTTSVSIVVRRFRVVLAWVLSSPLSSVSKIVQTVVINEPCDDVVPHASFFGFEYCVHGLEFCEWVWDMVVFECVCVVEHFGE